MRWSRFKDLEAGEIFELYRDEVFPFIKQLYGNSESVYSRFMKDAVFIIPTPSLPERVVTMLAEIPMQDRDTKGDLYEYMLGKMAVDHSVLCVTVWLARWRCRRCHYVFTDYPDFRTPV